MSTLAPSLVHAWGDDAHEPCVLSVAMHTGALDVTELSQAENALSKLGQRLIKAQEEERASIADTSTA